MTHRNAMLVAMGSTSPEQDRKQLQRYAGRNASVQLLGPDPDLKAAQTAILTGGSVATAVGEFNYTANSSGTINPAPRWVTTNFRPRRCRSSEGLSFQSFGTAVDLNVPGNGRGTRGDIDRTVVAIFKKWGFGWGGLAGS